MGENITIEDLQEIAERIGIEVRHEPIKVEGTLLVGGYCVVRGKPTVIVNKKAPRVEKVRVLVEALKRHDLSNVYLKPAVRKLLECNGEEGH